MVSFNDATKDYNSWLVESGVKFLKSCRIADLRSANEGRGVVAEQDIPQGEIIFEIPRSLMLNLQNCTLVKHYPDSASELELLNQWEALIIILLYEIKVQDGKSKWAKYFKVLPILDDENYTFHQLMFWSQKELKQLNPSLITQRIGRDMANAMYKKLFPKIVVEKLGLVALKDTTLDEYHKIASLIMSYSFDVEKLNQFGYVDGEEDGEENDAEDGEENGGNEAEVDSIASSGQESPVDVEGLQDQIEINDPFGSSKDGETSSPPTTDDECLDGLKNDSFLKSMIPLADTLNADTNHHNASLEYEGDKLVIRSIKPIKSGEQIYNTYSDHPNSEILRRYGYVEVNGSKHDFGEIPMANIRNYFDTAQNPIHKKFFDELVLIFQRIVEQESDGDEVVDFVLDSYDCFVNGEVIIELIIFLQCLTIIASINTINSMEGLKLESKFQLVRRIYRKCIQLIEIRKLTRNFLVNYKAIIRDRLSQFPDYTKEELPRESEYTRKYMAAVVLRSEYNSLTNCLDTDKAFTIDDTKYSFIDDERLIRNIIKRRFDLPIPKSKKPKPEK